MDFILISNIKAVALPIPSNLKKHLFIFVTIRDSLIAIAPYD